MRKIICLVVCLVALFTVTACNMTNETSNTERYIQDTQVYDEELRNVLCSINGITNVREETIIIPGLEKEYKFLYIADLHIIVKSDEIAEKDIENVNARYEMFTNINGVKSEEIYKGLIENINQADIDGVLMGGDMMDYLSKSNWDFFKDGLDRLSKPYLFATADHDVCAWWTSYSKKEKKALKKNMELDLVNVLEYEEFIILSIGENTSQLTEEALKQIKDVFAIGKPIIIVTHVPYESMIDTGLTEQSKAVWGDRALIWGKNTSYVPDETTQEFVDMLHAKDTPVVAVLAGHLHFEYICMLNENVKQYVFNPGFLGEIVVFTIKGQ